MGGMVHVQMLREVKNSYLDLQFLFLLLNYHSWESRECEKVPGNHLLSLLIGLGDMDQPKIVGMICENEKNWFKLAKHAAWFKDKS